jgi:hypothetical protein
MIYYLMFTLRCRQADLLQVFHSPGHGIDENPKQGLITGVLVTTTPAAGVINTGGQLIAGVITKWRMSASFLEKNKNFARET